MVRWLLVLLLTFGVGFGVVDACPDGRCADDATSAMAAGDDCDDADCAGDEAAGDDAHDDCEHHAGCDSCPPSCAGCRVTATVPPLVTPTPQVLAAALALAALPPTPISAPTQHGLFRPPRA